MTTPGISAVIPHYGDIGPTWGLVESLQRQQGMLNLQIIVADDASPVPFPSGEGYELVRREKNGGYGSACNSGAALAEHDQLLFLNSDLQVDDHFVADLFAAASPWQPAVTSPAILEPRGPNDVPRKFPKPIHYVVEWLVPLARFHGHQWLHAAGGHDMPAVNSEHAVVTDWLVGACHMMPTADFRAVGGFDEAFFMNCEETDLHLRLRKERGLPCVFLPEVQAEHGAGGSSDPTRRSGWLLDSRFRYAHKWGGAQRLHVGLLAASWVNWLWNSQRQIRGLDVHANRVLRQQLAWIGHGWKERGR